MLRYELKENIIMKMISRRDFLRHLLLLVQLLL